MRTLPEKFNRDRSLIIYLCMLATFSKGGIKKYKKSLNIYIILKMILIEHIFTVKKRYLNGVFHFIFSKFKIG